MFLLRTPLRYRARPCLNHQYILQWVVEQAHVNKRSLLSSKASEGTTDCDTTSNNNININNIERPRASNPMKNREYYFYSKRDSQSMTRTRSRTRTPLKSSMKVMKPNYLDEKAKDHILVGTVAEYLHAQGESIPKRNWLKVLDVPPVSSLDAILVGVNHALNVAKERGIHDLEADWKASEDTTTSIPCLSFPDNHEWVRKAKLILSPFGRPTGWKIELENRSVLHALLKNAKTTPVLCASVQVEVSELEENDDGIAEYPQLSDATLRLENCPHSANALTIMNFFARYDLRMDGPSIVQWSEETSDGRIPPPTWLVHFADASWARAALREKQAAPMAGKQVILAQFPKQIL